MSYPFAAVITFILYAIWLFAANTFYVDNTTKQATLFLGLGTFFGALMALDFLVDIRFRRCHKKYELLRPLGAYTTKYYEENPDAQQQYQQPYQQYQQYQQYY